MYLKELTTRVPVRISGIHFGFGQTCGAENGVTDCVGTFNCPFFVEDTVADDEAENVVVWDSMGLFRLFPGLLQSMVAL